MPHHVKQAVPHQGCCRSFRARLCSLHGLCAGRVDHMPYGDVKDRGFGREGVRFAMEDTTEIRLLVVGTRG